MNSVVITYGQSVFSFSIILMVIGGICQRLFKDFSLNNIESKNRFSTFMYLCYGIYKLRWVEIFIYGFKFFLAC